MEKIREGESLRFDPRHHLSEGSASAALQARHPARFAKQPSQCRFIKIRQLRDSHVTHPLSGAAQNMPAVPQLRSARKSERDVSGEDADVADAVADDVFGRAVQKNNLRAHLEDVLVARRHLFMDYLT